MGVVERDRGGPRVSEPVRHLRAVRGRRSRAHRERDHLLRLALDLEVTDGHQAQQFAVAHVGLGDVARAAGVTRSALYRLWPSRQDFRMDLIDHILGPDDPATGTVPSVPERPLPQIVDATQDVLITDRVPLLRAGLVGHPGPGSAAALAPGRHGHVDLLRSGIERRLRAGHLRCVAGVTATDLAMATMAVGNGLAVVGRLESRQELTFTPTNPLPAAPDSRTLLGILLGAIDRHLTEALDRPDAADPAPEAIADPNLRPPAGSASTRPDPTGRRRDYLDLAATLAVEPGEHGSIDHVLGHITLGALARAAGVSRRTLSNVWPSQADFRLDLLAHLLEGERQVVATAVRCATDPDTGTPPTSAEAFRLVGDHLHRAIEADVGRASWLAFAPFLEVADVWERAVDAHAEQIEVIGWELRRLLGAFRLRTAPGVSLRQLAIALTVVADGTTRLLRTDRGVVGDDVGGEAGTGPTVTGWVVAAILTELTEPVDDRRDVAELAALLG